MLHTHKVPIILITNDIVLSTISIIPLSCSTALSKTKTLKSSKVMAKNRSNKRIDQMHENQENSHNRLQYIT